MHTKGDGEKDEEFPVGKDHRPGLSQRRGKPAPTLVAAKRRSATATILLGKMADLLGKMAGLLVKMTGTISGE
jgi:hypothetical protein